MRREAPLDVGGYLRQVRRRTRMSQRELAAACAVSPSTISRTEAGRSAISVATFTCLLRAAGLRLVVVDEERRLVPALKEPPATRDLGDRRFPAHLDLILDPENGEWWGDHFGLVRPPETFHRDPAARYAHRLVFHRERGVLVHGEDTDWRTRVERRKEQFARADALHRAQYDVGVIPYRRSRENRPPPRTSVDDRARHRDR